jgi:hypothetical protein
MAKKDYLEGYEQGLKRGKENPITGSINKKLDKALGNPRESAKRGIDQGYDEMKEAIKLEEKRKRMKVLPAQLTDNPVTFKKESERTAEEKAMMSEYEKPAPYKKGGSVSSASKRADGCAVRGKTRA